MKFVPIRISFDSPVEAMSISRGGGEVVDVVDSSVVDPVLVDELEYIAVVVYHRTIINVMVPLGILKCFCRERFKLL